MARLPIDTVWHWMSGTAGFDCPGCGEEIILFEGGDTETCECGMTFKMYHYIEVMEEGNDELPV